MCQGYTLAIYVCLGFRSVDNGCVIVMYGFCYCSIERLLPNSLFCALMPTFFDLPSSSLFTTGMSVLKVRNQICFKFMVISNRYWVC